MQTFEFKTISHNSDATTTCNVLGSYPIKVSDFIDIILKENSMHAFRIEFTARNLRYGGVFEKIIEFNKDENNNWCCDNRAKKWLEEIKNENIIDCVYNGGWGQDTFVFTLKEPDI